MSNEPIYGPTTTVYASQGGGAKWLLGAAAALAISSGYTAWNTAPSEAQLASYHPDGAEPLRAGPLPPSLDMITARAAAEESIAASLPAEPRTTPRARRAPSRAATVLEATIGVADTTATDSEEIVVTRARRPIWARTPSPRRLAALYPERARERGREGEASLQCIIQSGGALDCERVSATPGFAAAALRVARRFRHAATLADGSDATGAELRLRVVFRMANEDTQRG